MFDGKFEFVNIKIQNIILIFFSQSGLLYPWCSSLLTRNLYIWNGIKILVNEIEAQIWYDITLVDKKIFFQNLSISVFCEDLFYWIVAFLKSYLINR